MSNASLNVLKVEPIRGLSDKINKVRQDTAEIVSTYIIPEEKILYGAEGDGPRVKLQMEVTDLVKRSGLWAPHLPEDYGGMGLGFMGLAYMNEILAWSMASKRCFGLSAPNSGNQSVLVKYGTEEQKKKWLEPLVRGEMESCFAMTEPDVAGSNPRAIRTSAVRDGDEWVINGRKWFISNANRADFAITMCRTEVDGAEGGVNHMMTQIIVPTDTPGFNIERAMPIWGHTAGEATCEITFSDVRVPLENQLGQRGSGHAAAQDRLGAGRVYHCMDCVGQMWRAFDLMVKRMTEREVHGGLQETKQFLQGFIADSYMDIQAARLMTIHCAEVIDSGNNPRTDISAIKVFVPNAFHRVVDRAMQVYGGLGVCSDLPLEGMYKHARTLRLADGPDEVHRILIAKNVLKRYHSGQCWDFGV
ncbi:MAG: acyl-CoA dehydrogenase family protein [Candidatus Hydrogenedentes bacterium]|nr:acyl-CoA dehydrogenase family protein [Candidatus Hydrogenedentota bacterium]